MYKKVSLTLIFLLLFFSTTACRLAGNVASEPTSTPSYETTTQEEVPSNQTSPTQPTSSQDQNDQSEAADRILQAIDSTTNHYPRTLEAKVVQPGGVDLTQVSMAFETETAYQASVITPNAGDFEIIVISPTVYVNMGGVWQSITGEPADGYISMVRDLDSSLNNTVETIQSADIQFAGKETIENVEVDKFIFDVTLADGSTSNAEIWIGAADRLLYQYTVENTAGTRAEGRYDFISPVTIQPPSNLPDLGQPSGSAFTASFCSGGFNDIIAGVIGRELIGNPEAFKDDYLGEGCSFDLGSDPTEVYFTYISLAPISSFKDSQLYGTDVTSQIVLSEEAFTVDAADAQQLWVKLNQTQALVIAIGDRPNPDAAIQLAMVLIPLLGLTP